MTNWEGLPESYRVILHALPDLRSITFEWSVRPGLSRPDQLAAEEWIHARITAWREGRALEDSPWMWDNAAAKYQVVARAVEIDGGT